MSAELIGKAAGLFAATNVDDILVLAVFFGRAAGRAAALRVVVGWYAGFAATLAAAVAGALGARLLPESVVPYLGLLPLLLGVSAAWTAWRERPTRSRRPPSDDARRIVAGPGVASAGAVSLANGGDNIGVYVPVFAASGTGALPVYAAVFIVLLAVWCAAGYLVASHPAVAKALSRWGHILLPVVLIGLGLIILVEGHAFGL